MQFSHVIRQLEPVHPVARFAKSLRERAAVIAELPTWSMTTDEQGLTLVELARAEAAGVGDDVAAASAADWVAVETRQVRRDARAGLKLANRLPDLPLLALGMAHGEVNLPQAHAIVRALDQPSTVARDGGPAEDRSRRHRVVGREVRRWAHKASRAAFERG